MSGGTDPKTAGLRRDETGDRSALTNRSQQIDGLRGLAALMVLIAHAASLSGPVDQQKLLSVHTWASRGGSGVFLFFVLSGYLIAGPFIGALTAGRRRPALTGYALRRIARIVPAYWIALACMVTFAPPAVGVRWWQLPLHASLTHGWVPGEQDALYFVGWSLSAEATFYVLVPIAAYAMARCALPVDVGRLAWLVLGVFVVGWGLTAVADVALVRTDFRLSDAGWVQLAHNSPLPFLASFCPGIFVALALTPEAVARGGGWALLRRLTASRLGVPLAIGLGIASFVLFAGATWPIREVAGGIMLAVAYGLLLGVVVQRGRRPGLLRLLAPVGVISYGIYLWHWIVKTLVDKHLPALVSHGAAEADLLNVALVLALTVPLATASWLLVERPAIHWAAARARVLAQERLVAAEPRVEGPLGGEQSV